MATVNDVTSDLTNAQWAWEYLRRNQSYRCSYREWRQAFDDDGELSLAERDQINTSLELLGPWKRRYAPWVQACLQTGRPFIHRREVNQGRLEGHYFEAKHYLDPMAFLLTEWLDPGTAIPADCQPFDQVGSLNLAIADEHSTEFQAALRLGLINVFTPTRRSRPLPGERDSELPKLDELPRKLNIEEYPLGSVVGHTPMYGWPRPPFANEIELARDYPEFAFDMERERELRSRLGSPKAIYHSVHQVRGPNGMERVDGHFNIQFDLTQPLNAQLAAARELLIPQQKRLSTSASMTVPLPGEIEVSGVLSTYERGLELLDAYDSLGDMPQHGRIAQAIRIVLKDPRVKSKDSEYERLEKAFRRADMLRNVGYRSLAFLKDTNRRPTITTGT
ncbi:transcriptional regulator domain-containing protein [Variovorax sp. Varisp62]|uniref:transcriptional regulator domain-containing protein n=1 Tax=Variovorax sp. Varisp62 TaxID=3243049 RepID=UPI0039B4CDA6